MIRDLSSDGKLELSNVAAQLLTDIRLQYLSSSGISQWVDEVALVMNGICEQRLTGDQLFMHELQTDNMLRFPFGSLDFSRILYTMITLQVKFRGFRLIEVLPQWLPRSLRHLVSSYVLLETNRLLFAVPRVILSWQESPAEEMGDQEIMQFHVSLVQNPRQLHVSPRREIQVRIMMRGNEEVFVIDIDKLFSRKTYTFCTKGALETKPEGRCLCLSLRPCVCLRHPENAEFVVSSINSNILRCKGGFAGLYYV